MKKTAKKLLSTLLALIMLLSLSAPAFAAGSSINNATSITFNKTYSDSITESSPKDYYKFTLSESGRVDIGLTAYIYRTSYYIYDSNGNEIWSKYGLYWNNTSQQLDLDEKIDLTSGTYYFCVEKCDSKTGNYNFSLKTNGSTVIPTPTPDPEPDIETDVDTTPSTDFDIKAIFSAIWSFFVMVFNWIAGLFA